ncbi:MAG: MFS transporter [Thermoanaerobaculia bacterium]
MTSRPTVLASIVLALALLGDSLLYAVLPLHATTFGVSLAWVGVLLSANRIVRLFAYPLLPRVAATGLRRFTITAAAAGTLSTLVFAFGRGASVLLASRLAWGIVFGALSLSTLAYATERSESAGKHVGLSLSVRELGPLFALTCGTAGVVALGVRASLAVLGVMSFAGVFVAMLLPDPGMPGAEKPASVMPRRRTVQWLSFVSGFVTDGIFPATIGLLLARSTGLGAAVFGTGLLLALKRLAIVVLAPIGGHAADRYGAGVVTAAGFAIAAVGATAIGFDQAIAGAVLLSCGAAVTTTTIPAAAAAGRREERVGAIALNGMTRDAGAALGPLVALALFHAAGAAGTYGMTALLLSACSLLPLRERRATEPETPICGDADLMY